MFSVFVKLSWFFKMYWKRYTIVIILLIFAGFVDIVPPKLIGYAIDGIHEGTLTGDRLYQLIMWFVGLIVFGYVITYIWMYKLFGGAFLLERLLRTRLMNHFMNMTSTFYERNRTGELMAKATNDLNAVSVTAGFGILTMVDSSVFMLTIVTTMTLLISWKLTLAALLPLPIMAAIMQRYGKKIHTRFTSAQDAFGKMNNQVLESIAGVRVIRAYVQEKVSQEDFHKVTDDVYQKNVAIARIDALFEPTIKVLVGVSYLIGLCYGAYLVYHNELTLGGLVSFNVYLGMLIWPMFTIGELINIMQRGNASLDRVNETLMYAPEVQDAPDLAARPMNHVAGTIRFHHVTFRYPSSQTDNLSDISFTLHRGQTLGIVGKTGSGKTTLLKQLLREYPLGRGSIEIDGISLSRITLDKVRSWIGYVPQEPILFSKTVRENILFGRKQATEEHLHHALELASFNKDVKFLSAGVNTLVGEKGVALSGGQKQRVSIARALIADPEMLLMDDALSAVDARTEAEIISGIRRERAEKTTIITTHRLSAVQHADWIIVLEAGRIVEEGTHEQLLQLQGWYKEQYVRQQIEGGLD